MKIATKKSIVFLLPSMVLEYHKITLKCLLLNLHLQYNKNVSKQE